MTTPKQSTGSKAEQCVTASELRCVTCGHIVAAGERARWSDNVIHARCFVCEKCHVPLLGVPHISPPASQQQQSCDKSSSASASQPATVSALCVSCYNQKTHAASHPKPMMLSPSADSTATKAAAAAKLTASGTDKSGPSSGAGVATCTPVKPTESLASSSPAQSTASALPVSSPTKPATANAVTDPCLALPPGAPFKSCLSCGEKSHAAAKTCGSCTKPFVAAISGSAPPHPLPSPSATTNAAPAEAGPHTHAGGAKHCPKNVEDQTHAPHGVV